MRRGMFVAATALSAALAALTAGCARADATAPAADVAIEGMPDGLMPPAQPCAASDVPAALTRDTDGVTLTIAARDHAPGHPPEGWCGEVAIQEAALYHGAWFPQKAINAAGKPAHADLYAEEIPTALGNLGLRFASCRRESRDLGRFVGWVRREVLRGCPVLVGVKIHPTTHDNWILDHFMLTVGVEKDRFVFNTTSGKRETRTRAQLCSTDEGYAFKNRFDRYYALSIMGQAGLGRGHATVRLFVEKEEPKELRVIVRCEGLKPAARYVVYRLSSPAQRSAKPLAVFRAASDVYALRDTIPPNVPALYRCRLADAQASGLKAPARADPTPDRRAPRASGPARPERE